MPARARGNLEVIGFGEDRITGIGDSGRVGEIINWVFLEGYIGMPLIANLTTVTILPPPRLGGRPRMHPTLPHLQLDQLPPLGAMEELVERSLEIPNIRSKQSRMASPSSQALCLADHFALGPPDAFIDDHEFCHLHPLPEGNIHLTLPRILRQEVVRLGWGERHPIAVAGILTTLVTLYAPRDRQELSAVLGLIVQSYRFAQGKLQVLHGDEHCLREAQ
jgi:hypothetical protein